MECVKMTGRSTIQYVVDYVRSHPGCTKFDAASGNTRYGYAAVNRAINRGLIRYQWNGRRYQLYVVT
jgi:hypothetical protein